MVPPAPRVHRRSAHPPDLFGRIARYFRREIWLESLDELPWPRRVLRRIARLVYLTVHGVLVDQSFVRASALTYITVLSLVPLLAFAFAVAKGVGVYDRLRTQVLDPFMDRNFGLAGESVPEAVASLRLAVEKILDLVTVTDFSNLGAVGLIIVVYALIRVLSNVEGAFNDIWGVQRARSPLRKLADYLSIGVLTPVVVVFSVGMTTAAQGNRVVAFLHENLMMGRFLDHFFKLTPIFALWIAFTLLYLVLPNTRIRFLSGLLGGVLGGTLWQLAQVGHVRFQIGIANYNAIYSSFAAIPIFLVWIYVSWVVVMIGAEFAHAHQSQLAYRNVVLSSPTNHAYREGLALRAMVRIARAFRSGEAPWTGQRLAEDIGTTERNLFEALQALVDGGILAESGDDRQPFFVPARDLSAVRVKDLLDALKHSGEVAHIPPSRPYDDALTRLLASIDHELADSPHNLSLQDLVDRLEDGDPDGEAG